MSSQMGERLILQIFGESHGPAVGGTLNGLPAGIPLNHDAIQAFLDRRRPHSEAGTQRKESDTYEIVSGVYNGMTTGMPLTVLFRNRDVKSSDYGFIEKIPRPGHADYPAYVHSGGYDDLRGGGHHSGRLTLPCCFFGAIAIQLLAVQGIRIASVLTRIGDVHDPIKDTAAPDMDWIRERSLLPVPMLHDTSVKKAEQVMKSVAANGDSIGGQIECVVTGWPAGIGEPFFDGMKAQFGKALFSIPGVKGVSFGDSDVCAARGSAYNDLYESSEHGLCCRTNHAGGILGGYTNGMPIVMRVDMRPPASIAMPQNTAAYDGSIYELSIGGRHDICFALRALPVVESMAALVACDALMAAGRMP